VLECKQDACSVFFDPKNQKRLILSPINLYSGQTTQLWFWPQHTWQCMDT